MLMGGLLELPGKHFGSPWGLSGTILIALVRLWDSSHGRPGSSGMHLCFTICGVFVPVFSTSLKVPIDFHLNFLIQEKSMGSIFLFG